MRGEKGERQSGSEGKGGGEARRGRYRGEG